MVNLGFLRVYFFNLQKSCGFMLPEEDVGHLSTACQSCIEKDKRIFEVEMEMKELKEKNTKIEEQMLTLKTKKVRVQRKEQVFRG